MLFGCAVVNRCEALVHFQWNDMKGCLKKGFLCLWCNLWKRCFSSPAASNSFLLVVDEEKAHITNSLMSCSEDASSLPTYVRPSWGGKNKKSLSSHSQTERRQHTPHFVLLRSVHFRTPSLKFVRTRLQTFSPFWGVSVEMFQLVWLLFCQFIF